MAFASRLVTTTTTTGTANLVLSGTGRRDAVNGDFSAPAERLSRVGNKQLAYYLTQGATYAFGVGALSADGLSLIRDADEKSWNGTTFSTSKLNLVAGTTVVTFTPRGEDLSASNVGRSVAARMGAYLA